MTKLAKCAHRTMYLPNDQQDNLRTHLQQMIHLNHLQTKKNNSNNPTTEKRKSKKFMVNLLLQLLLVLHLLVTMGAAVVMAADLLVLEDSEVLCRDMDDNSTLSLNHLIRQINTIWNNSWQFLLTLLSYCRLLPTT